jgi:hypothetical protein
MSQAKRASKRKRPSKAVSVLGIAGVSLAASASGSPADIPPAPLAAPTVGSVVWENTAPFQIPALDEEDISGVSLATFSLFDKENLGDSQSGIQLAFRTGCGCGHGCGGCRGCGGFRGCGSGCGVGGCRGCGVGWRGCGVGWRGCGVGWGGCGGCGWGWGAGGCCLSWGGCYLC